MKRLSALAFVCALLLAACGGSHSTTTTVKPGPLVVAGHPCLPANLTTQCVLKTQPPAPVSLPPVTAHLLYGLDGWGPPSLATIKSQGYAFGVAYFSYDPSKNWNLAAVNAYHAAGKGTVGVWETTQDRSEEGPIAGAEDAVAYRSQTAAVGDKSGPLRFAIDCDCAVSAIRGYFSGARKVIGSRTNAYGGYYQILGLHQLGLVGAFNWQAYAWSGGRWLPANVAPLEQYLNGNQYDFDRALAPNYGQWPAPGGGGGGKDPFAILDHTRRHFRIRAYSPTFGAPYTVVASEHGTMTTIRARGCHGAPRRPVCKSSKFHLTLLRDRLVTVGTREHPHYRLKGQGARQTIMAKQLARLS